MAHFAIYPCKSGHAKLARSVMEVVLHANGGSPIGNVVPSDATDSSWPAIIAAARGRMFVLPQQMIDAEKARWLGVVSEIVPHGHLLARADEDGARKRATAPTEGKLARTAMTQKPRRFIDESAGHGLALEGI